MKITKKNINSLIEAEYNPRQLTEQQFEDLKASIQKFGFVDPIIINKNKERKNIIIGGHQRYKVAKMLNMKEVPCFELDLNVQEEQELNVRLNKNTGEWDWDILANNFDNTELLDWGFAEQELGIKKADLDFIATGEDVELTEYPEDINDSEVKLIQLFFTIKERKLFDKWIDALKIDYGTKNPTDTLYQFIINQGVK
tara:strand:- start:7811 stop:8404 length:594 start_codon:yes stop_codon:yes gene_type:complete